MNKLSPQKEIIVSTLRDLKWHCGREWLNRIKDDRTRITELNRGYMKERGYEIVPQPCRGAYCGVKDCPLYARRAQKIQKVNLMQRHLDVEGNQRVIDDYFLGHSKEMVRLFDAGKPASQIFSV